jgi:hypothetical protein
MTARKIRKPIVVVVRDPDHDNEINTFGIVNVLDIDVTSLRNGKVKPLKWGRDYLVLALRYADAGHNDVASLIYEIVEDYIGDGWMQTAVIEAKEQHEKETA